MSAPHTRELLVSCQLINQDGTVDEQARIRLSPGENLEFWDDNTKRYVVSFMVLDPLRTNKPWWGFLRPRV